VKWGTPILAAYFLMAGAAMAQGYDATTAFSDGRSLGSGAITGAQQGIGATNAATVVPGYGQATGQTGLFQGGQGQLSGPGVTKVTDCASQTPDADEYRPVSSNFCSTARQISVDQHHRYQCVEQMQSVSNASCYIGQQIAVDTSYRYQCNQTVQGYESLSCRRGVSVTVGFGQCTPGAWLGRTAFMSIAAGASIRTWR
jgi:hypothetical protein